MERQTILAIILSVIAVVLVLTAILFFGAKVSKSPESYHCNSLSYSGEKGINLVFFGDKDRAEKYSSDLLKYAPFDSNKNAFNFWYISDYKPECEIYQGKAVFCYSKELLNAASSCPNDYIFAFEEKEQSIRSSSFSNVLSINLKHAPSVVAHEFGHAFANFAEEYTPADLSSGSKNCVKKCEDFWGEREGCYSGCSKSDYFRSFNAGIMRTLSASRYGTFDENLLSKLLLKHSSSDRKGIVGNAISQENNCQSGKRYLITFTKSGQQFFVKDIETAFGCAATPTGEGDYSLVAFDSERNLLEPIKYSFVIYTDSQAEGAEEIQGEQIEYDGDIYVSLQSSESLSGVQLIDIENKTLTEAHLDAQLCKV